MSHIVIILHLRQRPIIIIDAFAVWIATYRIFLNCLPIYKYRTATASVLRRCFFIGLRVHIFKCTELLGCILDAIVALIVFKEYWAELAGQRRSQGRLAQGDIECCKRQ